MEPNYEKAIKPKYETRKDDTRKEVKTHGKQKKRDRAPELCKKIRELEEKDEYFFEFDMSQLLRGDTLKQMQAWVLAKRNGIYNADEIRGWDNHNPIPGGLGAEYIVEKNMIGLSDIGKDDEA